MKNNSKCVRMSNETLDLVMSCRGDGFNEKFSNLVYDYMCKRDEMQREINRLQGLIDEKMSVYKRLCKQVDRLRSFGLRADSMNRVIDSLIHDYAQGA